MPTFTPSTAGSEFYDGIISPNGGLYKPGPPVMLPPSGGGLKSNPVRTVPINPVTGRPIVSPLPIIGSGMKGAAGSGIGASGIHDWGPDRLPVGTPVVSDPPQTFSPGQVAGIGTDIEGNRSAFVPLPRRRPALAAIDGAMRPSLRGNGPIFPRMAILRQDRMPPANQEALAGFDANAILGRSQDPAMRALGASRGGPRSGVVRALAQRRMSPAQGYDQANLNGRMRALQGMSTAPAGMRNPNIAALRQQGMNGADAYAMLAARSRDPILSRIERTSGENSGAGFRSLTSD